MGKSFDHGLHDPVLVRRHALATKPMPWALRFRMGTICVDSRSGRTLDNGFFHFCPLKEIYLR